MEEAPEFYENSSNRSSTESEKDLIDSGISDHVFDDEQDEDETVTDDYGSYDEVSMDDYSYDIYEEESYHTSPEDTGSSGNKENGFVGPSKGKFATIDEVDENYFDESLIEGLFAEGETANDIVSEYDQSFGYLSIKSEADNSPAERSVPKYDADVSVDASSHQESSHSASSYSATMNTNSGRRPYGPKIKPTRRIMKVKRPEETSLGTSLNYGNKALQNSISLVGDSSIMSTAQSPSTRKSALKTSSRIPESPKMLSESDGTNASESSTMVSKGNFSNGGGSPVTYPRIKVRRKRPQDLIPHPPPRNMSIAFDHSISIGESPEEKTDEPSTSSSMPSELRSRSNHLLARKQEQRVFATTQTGRSPEETMEEALRDYNQNNDPSTSSSMPSELRSRSNHLLARKQEQRVFATPAISPSDYSATPSNESVESTTASSSSDSAMDDTIFRDDRERCPSIAVLGTMSGTGKTVIAAALCRIFANGGTRCAPFKSQNTGKGTSPALLPDLYRRDALYDSFAAMVGKGTSSNNNNNKNRAASNGLDSSISIAPTKEQGYGQIGMAQSMQAEACKIIPRVQMNPIFFKPRGRNEKDESLCALVVMGKQIVRETYGDISKRVKALKKIVLESHHSLATVTGAEVIVIQGAGSCSELNLMDGDIVNLPLVRSLQCPWLLIANDENGGVFAQVIGTQMCVSKRDWSLCAGIIVNKVRGDVKEFLLGLKMLQLMTGKPIYAMPFVNDLNIANEEAIDIERRLKWERKGHNRKNRVLEANKSNQAKRKRTTVVVVAYPHTAISNDLYPLERDGRFHIEWRRKRIPKPYPTTSTVILPGSRLPMLDLKWLQDTGWADFLRKHVAAGGTVLGLCSGYQMLGWKVSEGKTLKQGIGLLPISSVVKPAECNLMDPLKGRLYPSGVPVEGFEVNCGLSVVVNSEQKNVVDGRYKGLAPLIALENGKPEGMRLGGVQGTSLHGILRSAKARLELLVPSQDRKGIKTDAATAEDPIDKFANHLETSGLDYDALRKIVFGKSARN